MARQLLEQRSATDWNGKAVVEEEGADLISHCRSLADELITNPMDRL